MAAADDAIAQRVTRYLNRRIAWLEEGLADLSALEARLASHEYDALLDKQEARERQGRQLDREHEVLRREWLPAKPHQDAHVLREVEALSERMLELTGALRKRYEEGVALVSAASAQGRNDQAAMRRSKNLLRHYRLEKTNPDFLDKNA